jgi:hypothetical protein
MSLKLAVQWELHLLMLRGPFVQLMGILRHPRFRCGLLLGAACELSWKELEVQLLEPRRLEL